MRAAVTGVVKRSYASAEETLFNLTSNAAVIEQWKQERLLDKTVNLRAEMEYHVAAVGVDLNKLSVVHVAGTKGKGSVCSLVESVLRAQGQKTGLFTSPHLISPRERIRLDGLCLTEEQFQKYFYLTHDRLKEAVCEEFPKVPPFFRFLTCMALLVFQEESVDVAVVEVGVGGRTCATNVVHPAVTAITRLGMDHCDVLGDTLEEIAAEKAGIIKPGVPCYGHGQKASAMAVLREHDPNIHISAPLDASVQIGLEGEHQRYNAGLAIDVCREWNGNPSKGEPLTPEELKGLRDARWAGRSQEVALDARSTCYIDGAHTGESMEVALRWFLSHPKAKRVLIFYCQARKDVSRLFQVLKTYPEWERVIFTTYSLEPSEKLSSQQKLAELWGDGPVSIANCVGDALRQAQRVEGDEPVQILVTGSLYLAGGTLKHLGFTPDSLFAAK